MRSDMEMEITVGPKKYMMKTETGEENDRIKQVVKNKVKSMKMAIVRNRPDGLSAFGETIELPGNVYQRIKDYLDIQCWKEALILSDEVIMVSYSIAIDETRYKYYGGDIIRDLDLIWDELRPQWKEMLENLKENTAETNAIKSIMVEIEDADCFQYVRGFRGQIKGKLADRWEAERRKVGNQWTEELRKQFDDWGL